MQTPFELTSIFKGVVSIVVVQSSTSSVVLIWYHYIWKRSVTALAVCRTHNLLNLSFLIHVFNCLSRFSPPIAVFPLRPYGLRVIVIWVDTMPPCFGHMTRGH